MSRTPLTSTGTRVPTILQIHGGPYGQFSYGFNARSQIFAGHGYAVGILLTTLNRPPGSSTVAQVLGDSASWLGAIAALALLAMATAWWRPPKV